MHTNTHRRPWLIDARNDTYTHTYKHICTNGTIYTQSWARGILVIGPRVRGGFRTSVNRHSFLQKIKMPSAGRQRFTRGDHFDLLEKRIFLFSIFLLFLFFYLGLFFWNDPRTTQLRRGYAGRGWLRLTLSLTEGRRWDKRHRQRSTAGSWLCWLKYVIRTSMNTWIISSIITNRASDRYSEHSKREYHEPHKDSWDWQDWGLTLEALPPRGGGSVGFDRTAGVNINNCCLILRVNW